MKYDDYTEKLAIIKKLIDSGNTGTPLKLAKNLKVSERTLRRMMKKLKGAKNTIVYDRNKGTYIKVK